MWNLIAWSPERASRIEWIQDHIAARLRVKLRQIFHCRVVHDGGFATVGDLREELPNGRALACAGVTHDQKVHRFALTRNTHPATKVFAYEAVPPRPLFVNERNAIRTAQFRIELHRRHQLPPAQPATMSPYPPLWSASQDRHEQCQHEKRRRPSDRSLYKIPTPLTSEAQPPQQRVPLSL